MPFAASASRCFAFLFSAVREKGEERERERERERETVSRELQFVLASYCLRKLT